LAQSISRAPLLCFLTLDPPSSRATRFAPFFDALRALGHVDGQTIRVHWASTLGEFSRYPTVAAECLQHAADVIVASSTPGAQVAKSATSTIPIVMLHLGDPVGVGLVDSLARPGANVTGTSYLATGMTAKRLELVRELVPGDHARSHPHLPARPDLEASDRGAHGRVPNFANNADHS
jgi:putative tryptophan/tyrosine transport system substrate-binding protein